jgi:CRISPR system Cascade subunit CasA
MNLLKHAWIPVRLRERSADGRLLTLEELLCGSDEWEIALPRDDLEMACLQMLASLVQVMFPPESDSDLRNRLRISLSPKEYAEGANKLGDWFDLNHPERPFMQTRRIEVDEVTPIQKLLIGLPEGNNHAFFNETGEVRFLGAPITAIALFHQAVNCPSFGGGFKGGLRGGAPITTLVSGNHLREIIWRNVLTRENVDAMLPGYTFDFSWDQPTWVNPIRRGESIYTSKIGLLRGLFWQPAHVELLREDRDISCDLLGGPPGLAYSGFLKEKFAYSLEGTAWPHPHGPLLITTKKNKREEKFLSFTTTAPAWTQMSEFVVFKGGDKEPRGSRPALPISQFGATWRKAPLRLLVGGYRANKASVVERRHELFSLASGWDKKGEKNPIDHMVDIAKRAKKALAWTIKLAEDGKKKTKPPEKPKKGLGTFAKRGNRQIGLFCQAEEMFYRRTETVVQRAFADMPYDDEALFNTYRIRFVAELSEICKEIFKDLTDPYAAKPELIPIIAEAGYLLGSELNKLRKELTTDA